MKISKLLPLDILSPPKMIFLYYWSKFKRKQMSNTAQKMKFSVKDSFTFCAVKVSKS